MVQGAGFQPSHGQTTMIKISKILNIKLAKEIITAIVVTNFLQRYAKFIKMVEYFVLKKSFSAIFSYEIFQIA